MEIYLKSNIALTRDERKYKWLNVLVLFILRH